MFTSMAQSTGGTPADGGVSEGEIATLIVFTLADRRFALPAAAVREIVAAVAIQALPLAPPIVEGVINARGIVVPVLDVRARFGVAPSPLHQSQHFIIVRTNGRDVALRVDRATEVVAVPRAAIRAPDFTPGVLHVAGVAVVDDGLIVIQDIDRFLDVDEAAAIDVALGRSER